MMHIEKIGDAEFVSSELLGFIDPHGISNELDTRYIRYSGFARCTDLDGSDRAIVDGFFPIGQKIFSASCSAYHDGGFISLDSGTRNRHVKINGRIDEADDFTHIAFDNPIELAGIFYGGFYYVLKSDLELLSKKFGIDLDYSTPDIEAYGSNSDLLSSESGHFSDEPPVAASTQLKDITRPIKEYLRLAEAALFVENAIEGQFTIVDLLDCAKEGKIFLATCFAHRYFVNETLDYLNDTALSAAGIGPSMPSFPKMPNDRYFGYLWPQDIPDRPSGFVVSKLLIDAPDHYTDLPEAFHDERSPLFCDDEADIIKYSIYSNDLFVTWNEIEKFLTRYCREDSNKILGEKKQAFERNADIVLIKMPKRRDDWFLAIEAAIRAFEGHHNRTPVEMEAWTSLLTSPPAGFGISKAEKGSAILTLAGEKPLDREAFSKRYKRYYPSLYNDNKCQ